jgi:hypothetical protein
MLLRCFCFCFLLQFHGCWWETLGLVDCLALCMSRPNIIADHITMVVDSLLNKILLCTRVGLVSEGSGNPFFWPYVFVWSSSFPEDQSHSLDLLRHNMSLLFGQANISWHVMLLLFVLSVRIMGCGCCFFIAVVCALSVCGKYLWKRIACFLREILTLQSNGWAHKTMIWTLNHCNKHYILCQLSSDSCLVRRVSEVNTKMEWSSE